MQRCTTSPASRITSTATTTLAREELDHRAREPTRTTRGARARSAALAAGGQPALDFKPELVRPWGDGDALQGALDRTSAIAPTMATVRVEYQNQFLALLGALGIGPAREREGRARCRACPVGTARAGVGGRAEVRSSATTRLGVELETQYRFIARHDELGADGGPLAERAHRGRGGEEELQHRARGCRRAARRVDARPWRPSCAPSAAATSCSPLRSHDPLRYRVIVEDKPEPMPDDAAAARPSRARRSSSITRAAPIRSTSGSTAAHIGQVAPGRRSALVADGGERTPVPARAGRRAMRRSRHRAPGLSARRLDVTLYCPK